MPLAGLIELMHEKADVLPLSVAQYHGLIDAGILPDGAPFELLDGFVVRKNRSAAGDDPMTISHRHAWVVQTLAELSPRLKRMNCHLRTQQPISLPPFDEPEPDAVIVLGSRNDYRERHPGPGDITCTVEVADASLARDRSIKLRAYAAAGIPQYVIVNLVDSVVEVYSQPLPDKGRYGQSATLTARQSFDLPGAPGKRLAVAVAHVLP